MNKLSLALVAAALVLLVVPPIYADQFFVIRSQAGASAVTNGLPGYGWTILAGPFATMDEAQRATGTGVGSVGIFNYGHPIDFARSVPRLPDQTSTAMNTP
jgi:hypothetical protein